MTDDDLSEEAKAFIETAEILAEPYQEKIAALRGEIEALTASLHAKDDHTPSAKRSADYWLRMLQACEAERDDLRAQLAAAQAQLAEAREVCDLNGQEADNLLARAEAAEARLEAARAVVADARANHEASDIAPFVFADELAAALWAAPQPEPDVFGEALRRVGWADPEPPASDEPARCEEESAYWFMARHDQHDVGSRHEDGSLLSATCHDCGETYRRSDEPARCEHDLHATNRAGERIGLRLAGAGSSERCPAASGTPDGGS